MRSLLIFVFFAAIQVEAAMTNVMLEPFAGLGVVNATSPRSLGIVNGNFYPCAVGPSTNGTAPGWSAVLSAPVTYAALNTWHQSLIYDTPAAKCGMIGAWFYIDSFLVDAPAHAINQLWVYDTNYNGNLSAYLWLDYYGNYGLSCFGGGNQSNIFHAPVCQWFWLGLAWQQGASGGGPATFGAFACTNGVFFQIGTNMLGKNYGASFTNAFGGMQMQGSAGSATYVGRYGCPAIYASDSIASFTYPAAISPPPNPPITWYCAPATGSDTNTGLKGSPWFSVTNLNWQLLNGGVFASTAPAGGGDVVIIDNTSPLNLYSNQLNLAASGCHVIFTNGPLLAYSTLSSNGWSKTSGLMNTYQITDAESDDLTNIVAWENDLWLNHPTGSTWTSVASQVDAIPGSFWCDGTNLYLHPFSNTVPTTDGFVYTRSRNRGGFITPGLSAVLASASNLWVDGLSLSKTCLARTYDDDPGNGYGLQFVTGAGGTNLVSNFNITYWSKHAVGNTVTATGMVTIRSNGWYGPGSPYVGYGGQTADVDFSSGGVSNACLYVNVSCLTNAGVVGGYGAANLAYPFWTTHGSAINNFRLTLFSNVTSCSFLSEQNCTENLIAENSSFAGTSSLNCNFTCQQCLFSNGVVGECASACSGVISNCVFKLAGFASALGIAGNQTVCNSTIDCSAYTNGPVCLWSRSGATRFTFYNNAFVGPPPLTFIPLLLGFGSGDQLVFNNNAYQIPAAYDLVFNYNGSVEFTFAQWQAAGFDANSISSTNIRLNPITDAPYSDSLLRNVGLPQGPLPDFTGILHRNRKTAGAFELENKGNFSGFQ